MKFKMLICKVCKSSNLVKKFEYFKRPHDETIYAGINYGKYHRIYYKCLKCGHYSGYFKMKINNLYSSTYNDATYSGKIKKNFDKINNLPSSKSDNYYRVERIDNFLKKNFFKKSKKMKILDVGSGLGIFPFKMSKKKYDVTALDPDRRSCLHLKKNLKIKALHGDFLKIKIKKKFQLVTLNKVIEHVEDTINFVNKAKKILKPGGFIYIEVPDAQGAAKHGKYREEFFIDHLHVFSKKSLNYLAKQLRLKIKHMDAIREPSSKFSIFAFLEKK